MRVVVGTESLEQIKHSAATKMIKRIKTRAGALPKDNREQEDKQMFNFTQRKLEITAELDTEKNKRWGQGIRRRAEAKRTKKQRAQCDSAAPGLKIGVSGERWSPGTVDYFRTKYQVGAMSTGRKKTCSRDTREKYGEVTMVRRWKSGDDCNNQTIHNVHLRHVGKEKISG